MTGTQSSPARQSHGCFWGCLAMLAFIFLPVLLAAGYSAWFIYQGYRRDPVLRGVVELVRRDGMAEQVLGEDIHVTGIEGSAFSYMWGPRIRNQGETGGSYVVDLQGSKGQGALNVTASSRNGQLSVRSMVLAAPDGARYDLLHHTMIGPGIRPGGGMTQSI